jgi:hypothetical protein
MPLPPRVGQRSKFVILPTTGGEPVHGAEKVRHNRYSKSGVSRVSFETSFYLKQPKLEPKLVSALSETKRFSRLFLFYTETESFGVLIEPNKQKSNQNSVIETYFGIFFRKFKVVSVCFGLFRSSLFRLVVLLLFRNRDLDV